MSRNTLAAFAEKAGAPLTIDTLVAADPGPGQIMVRLMAAGVCHTDNSIRKQSFDFFPLPLVLGHEGAGIVEASAVVGGEL